MLIPNQFQTQLFEEIFSSTKGKAKITKDLMEVLGCSRASLYRKRTGSTPLTSDELIKLANHFSLSIDALRSKPDENSQVVVCTTLPPINAYADIDFYLENTAHNLELAVTQPTSQLYFSAKELPLYRYIDKPTLSAFRYYLWVIENLRHYERFDPEHIPNELFEKGRKLATMSHTIKTTEFWLPSGFNNIIGQITYAVNTGRVSTRLKEAMKSELHEVLDTLILNIKTEKTSGGAPYQMILSHYLTLSDGALIEITPSAAEVLFSYSSVNYIKSSNSYLVDAFKRALRYHKLEGQALGALDTEAIQAFERGIRAKIESL
ncbi:MAG: hypothetical protein RL754_130 [Bacteroidota bacterium]|jgi:hypothetical protein